MKKYSEKEIQFLKNNYVDQGAKHPSDFYTLKELSFINGILDSMSML